MSDPKADPNAVPHKGPADVVYPNPQPPAPPVPSGPGAGQVTMPHTPANELPPPGFGAQPVAQPAGNPNAGMFEHPAQPGVTAPVPAGPQPVVSPAGAYPAETTPTRTGTGTIPPRAK